jgi:hypothetical protein
MTPLSIWLIPHLIAAGCLKTSIRPSAKAHGVLESAAY